MDKRVVITANRTNDGFVAYLEGDGSWGTDLRRARVFEDKGSAAQALERAQGQQDVVCDPYIFEVSVSGDELTPISARERIRAAGPDATLAQWDYA